MDASFLFIFVLIYPAGFIIFGANIEDTNKNIYWAKCLFWPIILITMILKYSIYLPAAIWNTIKGK